MKVDRSGKRWAEVGGSRFADCGQQMREPSTEIQIFISKTFVGSTISGQPESGR